MSRLFSLQIRKINSRKVSSKLENLNSKLEKVNFEFKNIDLKFKISNTLKTIIKPDIKLEEFRH